MATRAERYRYEAERSGPKKPPQPRRKAKRRGLEDAGGRNLSLHAERKAAVTIEESRSGKPSRKSTRGSENHGKNTAQLEYARRVRGQQPQARHTRRSGS